MCLHKRYVYGTQELKHGRSIKIGVKEAFADKGQEIPKGALLYGIVAFGKESVLYAQQ
ncbi:conjugative transposon protein TraM [Candidatus Cardinium hertigii]|uniref:conjugative transposon protein TraM n=1 Tax=Candidatus Cardinium hertigii TaxID=247481 RepID=UPI003F6D4F21